VPNLVHRWGTENEKSTAETRRAQRFYITLRVRYASMACKECCA
jgi:hypothetical protein